MHKNTLTIHWKSSPNFNIVSRKKAVPNFTYQTVDNFNSSIEKENHKLDISVFKHKGETRIITGMRGTTTKLVEQEHSVESFKNIKTLEKANKILANRKVSNIAKAFYKGELIFENKEELNN